ncbi:MAG: hypothetical protein AAFU69_14460, partial [Pseudomonadota bacterium]
TAKGSSCPVFTAQAAFALLSGIDLAGAFQKGQTRSFRALPSLVMPSREQSFFLVTSPSDFMLKGSQKCL